MKCKSSTKYLETGQILDPCVETKPRVICNMLDAEIWDEVPVKLPWSVQWSEKTISWKRCRWNCDLCRQKYKIWDNQLLVVQICFMGHIILFSSEDDSPPIIPEKVRKPECYVLKQNTPWIDFWCNLIFPIQKRWIWRERRQLLEICWQQFLIRGIF